ncbi:MAG TPA: AAA family ATPase [Bacteroidales bacterium]|jgi:exodeoxyribonuclease-5|nr:AAA family ATPase [Bacteroidales bacterium]
MRDYIIYNNLCKNLGYPPSADQAAVMKKIALYITENKPDRIFLVTGYAGTGKTSIISALVKTLDILRMKCVLLAPTGRAAKVLSSFTGKNAYTIHKKIYRQKSMKEGTGSFVLDRNLSRDTYFIVDEASMISNSSSDSSIFGSGRVLDDLIEYVCSGTECKLIIVGDTAQLPPVGSQISPALDPGIMKEYGFELITAELRQVLRQSETSGILMNATKIRRQIDEHDLSHPSISVEEFSDVKRISGEDLIDEISSAYGACGLEDTIIVVNSNKQANRYNQGIRNRIFFREEEVSPGDMVMVVKNNYFITLEEENLAFIANGDIAEIRKIIKYEERYGFRFAEMLLHFPDYDLEIESKVMLDVLHLDTPALPSDRNSELFKNIQADYIHLKSRRKQYEAVREDPYFNALQIKFAYAVTCHKAQGGQWGRVFIDQGMFNRNEITIDYLRWLYTALTRSTDKVYLVNFSDEFFS